MKKLFNNSTKGNDTQNKSSKSKRKFLRTFSFTSLALLMGAAGVFAFAPLGASPSVANANEIEMTTASGLGLDPKNDPVVYTTERGLQIKMSLKTMSSGGLTGYAYFQMGMYGGSPVNWVIIGRNSANTSGISQLISQTTLSNFFANKGDFNIGAELEKNTPAGISIYNNSSNSIFLHNEFLNFSNAAVHNEEISAGHVLCFPDRVLGTCVFGNSNKYYGSTLHTNITNLYNSGLALTDDEKKIIISQNITTTWYGSGSTETSTHKLFPLAGNSESNQFLHYEYFNNLDSVKACGTAYWLRTGYSSYSNNVCYISATGVYCSPTVTYSSTCGIRPACIVKLL